MKFLGTFKDGAALPNYVLSDYQWVHVLTGVAAPQAAQGTDDDMLTPIDQPNPNAPPPTLSWAFATCGVDQPAGSPNGFSRQDAFSVVKPVAGTMIPIDTVALAIAGIQYSALWLLPLIGLAGVGFAVLRFQLHKKED